MCVNIFIYIYHLVPHLKRYTYIYIYINKCLFYFKKEEIDLASHVRMWLDYSKIAPPKWTSFFFKQPFLPY